MGEAALALKRKIDKPWFLNQLRNQSKTASELAKYLKLDPSAVSRMLNDQRDMTMEEAAKTASFLGQPITEVMEHAGIPLSELNPKDTGMVRIFGTVNAEGMINMDPPKVAPYAPIPPSMSAHTIALRMLMEGTPLAHVHGWVLYYEPVKEIPVEAIDRLCVVKIEGEDHLCVRLVKRSFESGKYRLSFPWTREESDEKIESASPILWMKT
jgi:hypothetical protein